MKDVTVTRRRWQDGYIEELIKINARKLTPNYYFLSIEQQEVENQRHKSQLPSKEDLWRAELRKVYTETNLVSTSYFQFNISNAFLILESHHLYTTLA